MKDQDIVVAGVGWAVSTRYIEILSSPFRKNVLQVPEVGWRCD